VYAAGVAILLIFGWMLMKCDRSERAGLLAALILTMQVILFFIFYQQMSTSLTLFARCNVDPSFKLCNMTSFSWSAAQFQALNPLWITLLSAFLAIAYTQLARSGHDIPIAAKYALGSFVFAFSGRYAVDGRVSSWFMAADMGSTRWGELLVSGLDLAMIAHYVPARMSGFMTGAYYVATGVSCSISVAWSPTSRACRQTISVRCNRCRFI